MAQLHVKIFMGGDVRRRTLTAPFTFESLRAAVASVCAVPNAKILFLDDDNDLVLIESDAEFAEARRCAVAPDTLHVGVGPDGAAALTSASQLKKLGASVNTSSSSSNARPPREQSPKPRAVVSAPPTPAVAVAPAAPAADGNLKQLVEAAVQEALRGTLPHLQASMRQVDDAERRRVAALEQQLADVKQQLSESISMVSSMRVQPPPESQQSFAAREQQAVDAQLAEALRLSREEAKRAEAKAVADKIRASREEAAKQAAEVAARAQASPLSAAAPLFESLIVNRDGAGSATVDMGALLAAVAGSSDASLLLPFVRRFLQHPNDQAAVDELSNKLFAAYSAASGARAASPADARGAIQQALRYVQQRPHVREFLAELIESAPLGMLLRTVAAATNVPAAKQAPVADQSQLIASYRDDVKSGRVVCDECSTVIRGARFKCTTCADFDLCAPCEAKTQHNPEHALLKVRPPASSSATAAAAATPVVPVAAKPEEVLVSITDETPALIPTPAEASSSAADVDQAAAHAKLRGYRASLVRDVTLPDGARVRPGASLTKVWRLQNSGSAVWPTGSTLGFVGGSDFGAVPTAIPDNVEPGAMIDVTLRCTAPQRAGRYIGYWRLIDPRGSPYGERIWLDVDVDGVADNVAAPATAPVVVQAPVIAPPADESWTALAKVIEASNEKERQEKERLAKEKEERERREAEERRQAEQERARREAEQLEQARALAAAQQQKQKAAEAAAALDRQYGEKLRQLSAMGFTGDHVRVLIAKHNGNVLAVVQELLEDTNAV